MSRETKVGLIVAFSFMLMVGSVLTYKLYFARGPFGDAADNAGTQAARTADDEGKKPESGGRQAASQTAQSEAGAANDQGVGQSNGPLLAHAGGPANGQEKFPLVVPPGASRQEAGQTDEAKNGPPPTVPPDMPVNNNRPQNEDHKDALPPTDPILMPGGKSSPSDETDKSEPGGKKPQPPEEANGGMSPRERLRMASGNSPPADENKGGPSFGGPPEPPEMKSNQSQETPGGPPPTDPPGQPANKAGGDGNAGPPATELPPLEPPGLKAPSGPPDAPSNHPPFPETKVTTDNQTRAAEPSPAGSTTVPPMSPSTKFDRQYDPPINLGKPVVEPAGTSGRTPASGSSPTPPGKPAGGIPVAFRPQANVPSPAGTALPNDNWSGKQVGLAMPRVEVFDMEVYTARQGDTFATISKAKYQDEKYQQALSLFNRERNPQLETPQPGRPVFIPPADYLERRYATAIPGLTGKPPAPPQGNSEWSRTGTPPLGTAKETPANAGSPVSRYAPLLPQGSSSKEAARADWTRPTTGKQYRVKPNDTIWTIATQTLGKGERWPEILRLNREALRDVNQLQVGMVLQLPEDAKVDIPNPPP